MLSCTQQDATFTAVAQVSKVHAGRPRDDRTSTVVGQGFATAAAMGWLDKKE
jgi:hypothetical protein